MPSEICATEAPGPTITSSGTNSEGSRLIAAKTMQGAKVYARSGDTLGVIDDTVIDPATGHVVYYVIGLERAGSDLHPIPVARLEYDHARHAYITELSREQIESAPRQHENWFEDHAWQQSANEHYGVPPYRPADA